MKLEGLHLAGVTVRSGKQRPFFAYGIRIWGMYTRPVLQEHIIHFPVNPASLFRTRGSCHPLLAHNEACEQEVWRGDAQTVFTSSPLLYGPHLCSQPPPVGTST